MKIVNAFAGIAALALVAQPALAADDFRNIETRAEHRSAAFAGARIRVPIGSGEAAERRRPSARLQLGVDHVYEDRRSASPAVAYRTSGIELGFSRSRAAPSLFVGGAPARDVQRRLGVSTGGAIAIGVGVTLIALLAAVAVTDPPETITP
jgi:hypothetical protein